MNDYQCNENVVFRGLSFASESVSQVRRFRGKLAPLGRQGELGDHRLAVSWTNLIFEKSNIFMKWSKINN